MATMVKQSKIVCYHDELQAALTAALKVADKKTYGSIQFRAYPNDQELMICALNAVSTFVGIVPTEMCDIVAPRDSTFEVPLSEASILAKFPIKTPPGNDEVAKSGLLITERYVQVTDETGLGIGIRHARVRRNSDIELPGNPLRTIESARNATAAAGQLFPNQLDLIGKVGTSMHQKAWIRMLESPEGILSRVHLSGELFDLTVTEGAMPAEKSDESTEPTPQSQSLSFDDPQSDESSVTSIRVVKSKPPKAL